MNDSEDNPVGGDKIKTETTPKVKQDAPINDIEDSKQKVTEWLKTVRLRGRKLGGEGKENDRAKHLPSKERIWDFSHSVLSKSTMITSLPKLNLPAFDCDPCAWPNWYGMFKALADDQQLSKTQKMVSLKASVKGTAEKAIAGMFLMVQCITRLLQRFRNPTLISKSLINRFLERLAVQDENTSSLRLLTTCTTL